jgi:hypothetical protein
MTIVSRLRAVLIEVPEDFKPYGMVNRKGHPDCANGCRHFVRVGEPLIVEWRVCTSPLSHRRGLLTFEHQGCIKFQGT